MYCAARRDVRTARELKTEGAGCTTSAAGERPSNKLEFVRLVGINHVALEVDDVDEALAWYGQFFDLELGGRHGTAMAFIDMGDQFIALSAGRSQPPDQARHFGLVVDDKQAVRRALQAAGVSVQASGSLDFTDPWGNHVQVVDYREIQFSKAPAVVRGMGIGALEKTPAALQELRSKGLAEN
jgi:lactoylglutathione lyase